MTIFHCFGLDGSGRQVWRGAFEEQPDPKGFDNVLFCELLIFRQVPNVHVFDSGSVSVGHDLEFVGRHLMHVVPEGEENDGVL